MKIRAILAKTESYNDAQYYWRVQKPFEFLRKYKIDADTISLDQLIDDDVDILVIPKLCVPKQSRPTIAEMFQKVRANGTRVVFDADDDMWSESYVQYIVQMSIGSRSDLDSQHVLRIIKEVESKRDDNLWMLRQCDAVTVSTKPLADYVKNICNIPVFVVENAIDVEGFISKLDKDNELRHPHYRTVGWAGGSRPIAELSTMFDGWQRLAQTRDDIKFVISGWQPNLDRWPKVKASLLPVDWVSVSNYMDNMQVDVGCVSVGSGLFSSRKSVIKAWEFALAGAVVVGSSDLYKREPILVCDNADDWVKMINFALLSGMDGSIYRKYVEAQYDLEYNWLYWADAYQKIMSVVNVHERRAISV